MLSWELQTQTLLKDVTSGQFSALFFPFSSFNDSFLDIFCHEVEEHLPPGAGEGAFPLVRCSPLL